MLGCWVAPWGGYLGSRSAARNPYSCSCCAFVSLLWPSRASDGGVRDHSFLGTSVMCAYPVFSTEKRIGGPPIAYSVENTGTTHITLCETARFALHVCLMRDLSCSQAPPASPTRATLALVFPAGWGQTRHVDRPTYPPRYGYVAGQRLSGASGYDLQRPR